MKRPESGTAKPITDLEKEPHKTFIFPEAIFTAVTAYQNQLVSLALFLATVTRFYSFHLPSPVPFLLLFFPLLSLLSLLGPFRFFLTRSSTRRSRSALPRRDASRVFHVPPGTVLSLSLSISLSSSLACSSLGPSLRIIVSSLPIETYKLSYPWAATFSSRSQRIRSPSRIFDLPARHLN